MPRITRGAPVAIGTALAIALAGSPARAQVDSVSGTRSDRAAWRSCGGQPHTASVTFETTRAEIVDVVEVTLPRGQDPAVRRCLEDAVWERELPGAFEEDWNVWKVDV